MHTLKKFIPPVVYEKLQASSLRRHGWFGDFQSWTEAERASKGYDSEVILERVKTAMKKVENGEAAYERDSVVFAEMEYDWPIVGSLCWVASQDGGRLNVLDFGGSLGSTFYRNKGILKYLNELRWNVVEQPSFVKAGKDLFESDQLRFYNSIENCLNENKVNVVLLSSVLPYIKDPYGLLKQLEGFKFIIIDKMPLIKANIDRLTIQKVPKSIYPASYPAWFFSERKFMDYISRHFKIVADFNRDTKANFPSQFKGFVLTKQ
jgi:putative methyltransferase (TIGR04325 family)